MLSVFGGQIAVGASDSLLLRNAAGEILIMDTTKVEGIDEGVAMISFKVSNNLFPTAPRLENTVYLLEPPSTNLLSDIITLKSFALPSSQEIQFDITLNSSELLGFLPDTVPSDDPRVFVENGKEQDITWPLLFAAASPPEGTTFTDKIFVVSDLETTPEPTATLGFLALGTLGAASTLKRKLKQSKSPEKETTKVS
jgi:hypothetical protein